MSSLTRALVSVTLPLLVACGVAESRQNQRVQVKTAGDWTDLDALGERVARSAGVPVRDVAGIAPRRYVLTLACASAAECDLAMQRLSAEPGLIESVSLDSRARIPSPPSPTSSTAR